MKARSWEKPQHMKPQTTEAQGESQQEACGTQESSELGADDGSTEVARSQEGDALLGGTGGRQGQAPAYDGQVPDGSLEEHLFLVRCGGWSKTARTPATRDGANSLPRGTADEGLGDRSP